MQITAKNWLRMGLVTLSMTFLIAPMAWAQSVDDVTRGQGEAYNSDLGYGFDLETGALAIEQGRVFVHCKRPGILVVNADLLKVAEEQLKAKVIDSDTWVIDGQKYQLQTTNATFAGDREGGETANHLPGTKSGTVFNKETILFPKAVHGCSSVWQGYRCDNGPFTCPTGNCFNGFEWGPSKQWWRCSYTGNPFDFCAERIHQVCQLDQYTCADCTGPLIATFPVNVSACVVLP